MNLMSKHEHYQCCLVLAGGGFRFGYYLGVHAAAEHCGRRPDVLLASCGGAVAAAVITGLPDAQSRLDWVAAPAMYRFLRGIQSTCHATPLRTLAGATLRWLARTPAPHVTDLFGDYLFELSAELPLPDTLPEQRPAPDLAIVGGRLLYGPDEMGLKRGDRQLFEEVVFCNERAAALLDGSEAPAADQRWSCGAVAPALRVERAVPLAEAVRISITDMFYFRSHVHAGQYYTGGVIDLFPIELAQRLASEVVMERKSPFNHWLALPALRAVLGIDGEARLRHVLAQHADAWFDTRDVSQVLRQHGIGKRIDWTQNRVCLTMPPTHAAYAAQVHAQWNYGYLKGMAAFSGTPA